MRRVSFAILVTLISNIYCFFLNSVEPGTGIPRFMLLMWGHQKNTTEAKNRVNQGYLVVLKGRKIGQN